MSLVNRAIIRLRDFLYDTIGCEQKAQFPIAQHRCSTGQLQTCSRCHITREVDADRCPECGAPWVPYDKSAPPGQPHLF